MLKDADKKSDFLGDDSRENLAHQTAARAFSNPPIWCWRAREQKIFPSVVEGIDEEFLSVVNS